MHSQIWFCTEKSLDLFIQELHMSGTVTLKLHQSEDFNKIGFLKKQNLPIYGTFFL